MSDRNVSGLATFAVLCLLGETTGSARSVQRLLLQHLRHRMGGGRAINLGGLPGFTSSGANAINNARQAVGYSQFGFLGPENATEWSGGRVIDLGGLPGSTLSEAVGINAAGQAVGSSYIIIPETSTWAMLLGFGGLGFVGYRQTIGRAKAQAI
ncbi:MAG TPA: hypothetical protein VMF32_12195 [Xanthobacteraceae bacterium]|nr:hypothetical protein [Xanthobacteraceae bacterium]